MRPRRIVVLTAALGLSFGVITQSYGKEPASSAKTALDEYIAKPDRTYSWKIARTIPGDGYTTFVVDMKSQTWRSIPEVDRSVWQHWLVIVKPETVTYDTAFLTIGGGKNDAQVPAGPSDQLVRFAKATNTVT